MLDIFLNTFKYFLILLDSPKPIRGKGFERQRTTTGTPKGLRQVHYRVTFAFFKK